MKTFLEYVAEDIINKYGTDLSRIAVVFPNKRASLFLNEHLARMAGKPIWSPAYMTISDLFRRHSSMTVGDPIKLTCDIHKSFTEVTGIDETLDHFYGWGQLLLADFDDVDKNMADASKVFANLRDLHELDDISYLTTEQKEMLRGFFKNFTDNQESVLRERFLRLWNNFESIYNNFRSRLRAQNIAYEGMLYRDVATDDSITFRYDTYLFVGFNVIQKVEQLIFSRLRDEGRAHFYWDFDRYYMPKDNNVYASNEAGHYIAGYLKDFPNELEVNNEAIYSNFKRNKDITYLSASTENIQARYISTWLREKNRYALGRKTAIVLCDESLLQTVVHCIPDEVEKVNITTGYPLSGSPVSSYVSQLIALQINGYSPSSGRYRLKYISQILAHPYIRYVSDRHQALLDELRAEGRFYIRKNRLTVDENLAMLFTPTHDNASLLQWILDILRFTAANSNEKDPLFQESMFRMYTLMNRVSELIKSGDLDVDINTLQKLVSQLIATTSIPFHGEPAEGIQVMGVLETRNLDFEHILVLSCNEGNMPKGVNDSSFIPYYIRKAYGLTTIDNKVAIYAYYFNRLLQRAEDVCIAYNDSTEDGHTGEMSRFMLQVMVESGLDIKRVALQAGQNRLFNEPHDVIKDANIMERLDAMGYLSPTSINRYMSCPLKFYYNNVAGITEPDELEEEGIDNRVFGNIFHDASEQVYRQLFNPDGMITASLVDEVLKHREQIERIVDETFREQVFKLPKCSRERLDYNGLQLINREVIIRYIVRLLELDRALTPFRIIDLERKVDATLDVVINGVKRSVRIGGRIDRMDQVVDRETGVERIRIVDYKTGGAMFRCRINGVDDIFRIPVDASKHADYYLQTLLYSMIVSGSVEHNPQGLPVSPALLFIQHTKEDGYDPTLKIGKEKITDMRDYAEEFGMRLSAVVSDIFNPDIPFRRVEGGTACEYCPYRAICGV